MMMVMMTIMMTNQDKRSPGVEVECDDVGEVDKAEENRVLGLIFILVKSDPELREI